MKNYNDQLSVSTDRLSEIISMDRSSIAAHLHDCRESWLHLAASIDNILSELSSEQPRPQVLQDSFDAIISELTVHLPSHHDGIVKIAKAAIPSTRQGWP